MREEDKIREAYEEVLTVLNKHRDTCLFKIREMEDVADNHCWAVRLRERYNVDIGEYGISDTQVSPKGFIRLNDFMSLSTWGKDAGRTLSWSDDDRQPDGEYLLGLNFPTGAYIFGTEYLPELFKEFWAELLLYCPDYKDTTNKYLLFSLEKAGKVCEDFPGIFKKYCGQYKQFSDKAKIIKLKKQLAELECEEVK